MQNEWEISNLARSCAVTGRDLSPGETFFTALLKEGLQIERRDFSVQGWTGPPPHTLAWWTAQVPDPKQGPRPRWLPKEALRQYFEDLADRQEEPDMLHMAALLLVRRKALKLVAMQMGPQGKRQLQLMCPRSERVYWIIEAEPATAARAKEIELRLSQLLDAEAGPPRRSRQAG